MCGMEPTDAMIPLKNVSKYFASRPHYNTVRRWANEGLLTSDGTRVVLEVSYEGGTIFTTPEMIAAFKQALRPKR
jgi:hypothetical protein